MRPEAYEAAPSEHDVAGVWAVDPGDEIEQRRLTGTVRADHADDLVLVDVQVEVPNDLETAERLVDAPQLEQAALAHTISTLGVPSSPCGRTVMSATRSDPNKIQRATAGCSTKLFSQTIAAR